MDEPSSIDGEDLRTRSIRSASALVVGQVLRFALSMASQIFLARLLLPADFGLLAMVYPILGFVQLFTDFGLLQAVIQRPSVNQQMLSAIFWVNLAISLALGVVFAALSPLLAIFYHEPRILPVAWALSALIVISGMAQLPAALLNRRLRFGALVTAEIAGMTFGLAAGIAAAHAGLGYWALVIGPAVQAILMLIVQSVLAGWLPSRPQRAPEVAAMLRFGGQITGSKVVGYLNLTVDNVMVGARLGEAPLGLYSRAWGLAAQPLAQLSAPVDRLAIPILSRLHDDADRYRRAFGQMVQILCLLTMPGLMFGVIAADSFIPFLLGGRWHDIIPIFRWVCVGAVISPLNIAAFWLMVSQKRGGDHLTYSTLAAIINITAYAIGLAWGVAGVAMMSALSVYALQCPMLILASTRRGLVGRGQFVGAAWPVVAAIAVAIPILLGLTRALPPSNLIGLVIGGGGAYAITGAVLVCFPAGRRTLATVWMLVPDRIKQAARARLYRLAGQWR